MPLTRSARYAAPIQLAACYLNAATPPGLFVSERGEDAMLVHHEGESRLAITLDQSLGHEFKTWPLEPNATAWFGLALGPVELELDTSAITRDEAGIGCVELRGDRAFLITRSNAPWERIAVPLARSAGADGVADRGLTFTRWRLIQRDHLGAPVELFTHDVQTHDGGSNRQ